MLSNILSRLPTEIATEVMRFPLPDNIEEIRIRNGKQVCITTGGQNLFLPVYCTSEMFQMCLQSLSDHSLYSHAETIREGYISVDGGIRVGVCGQAVIQNGRMTGIREISSLCIRLPHRIYGIAQPLYLEMQKEQFRENVLIYSLPGNGKTTLLRELIPCLATGKKAIRIAVIDTRYELYTGISDDMADVLYGYERSTGMEIAIRTLSPQMILCDELMTSDDLSALENCIRCGIPVCATMHAASYDTIKPAFRKFFSLFCAVAIDANGKHRYTLQNAEGESICYD